MVSPTATSAGPQVLSNMMPGCTRLTEWLSEAVSWFPNPSTVQVAVAVFTIGSGSPAWVVRAALVVSEAPDARLTFLLTPRSGSLIVQVRFGVSADEVLFSVIV